MPRHLPSLADMRGETVLTPAELLKRARSAARLELRGAMFSPDDRADVAAAIVAAVLDHFGGQLPPCDAPRATLGRLCGDAKNYRRAIVSQRERDAADAAETPRHAVAETPAELVEIVGRAGAVAAKLATLATMRELGLTGDETSATFAALYRWARGETSEVCAADLGIAHGTYRVRATRGAKLVRGYFDAATLAARLTAGASAQPDGSIRYVNRDDSRKARPRSRMLADVAAAPHWRTDSALADASVLVTHCDAVCGTRV